MILSLKISLFLLSMVYVVLVIFMRRGWAKLPFFTAAKASRQKVSIIIAARNEAHQIERTITCLLAQDYPKELTEIIIIDDHSTDNTAAIVASYVSAGIKLVQLNESNKLNSYKKLAIAKAIQQAEGAIIVTTDADCRMSAQWLSTVMAYFATYDSYLVSSPVSYQEEKSDFERLQTLEFLYLIGLGAAGIGNGHPTTCNGANLAYRKDIFYELGGFSGIDQLASGDDELFLHKVAAKYPSKIGFCKAYEALVLTDAKPDLGAFISQRKRWASKSTKYKDKQLVALGLCIWFFNFLILINAVIAVFIPSLIFTTVVPVLLLKGVVEYAFLGPICDFMKRKELLRFVWILTPIHVLYLTYIGLAGNIGKYQWKGRIVR